MGATLGTRGINPITGLFPITDAVAVALILLFSGLLGLAVWRETDALRRSAPSRP